MSVLFPAHPDYYYHSPADRLVTESSFLFGLKIVSMPPPHSHGYFSSAPGDTKTKAPIPHDARTRHGGPFVAGCAFWQKSPTLPNHV